MLAPSWPGHGSGLGGHADLGLNPAEQFPGEQDEPVIAGISGTARRLISPGQASLA
jgi:hypothetical protein